MSLFQLVRFAVALSIPVAMAAALLAYVQRRRSVASRLGQPPLVRRLTGVDLSRVPRLRVALLMAAATALGGAIATGPRSFAAPPPPGAHDVVLVLDASNSMRVRDVAPNRIGREREAARSLVRGLGADRVGLVVFAGRAYVLSPLTADAAALELYLDALDPEIVAQGGTSLSAAIERGSSLLLGGRAEGEDRFLVVISDGEALEARAEVLAAARRAAEAGVRVFALGIGTADGGRVPEVDPATGEERGWKTGPDGAVVISRLDEELLREVARITGGRYLPLSDPASVGRVLAGIRGGEDIPPVPTRFGTAQWLLALALALLAIDALAEGRERSPSHRRYQGKPVDQGKPSTGA